jgi:hypothetical protein
VWWGVKNGELACERVARAGRDVMKREAGGTKIARRGRCEERPNRTS